MVVRHELLLVVREGGRPHHTRAEADTFSIRLIAAHHNYYDRACQDLPKEEGRAYSCSQ